MTKRSSSHWPMGISLKENKQPDARHSLGSVNSAKQAAAHENGTDLPASKPASKISAAGSKFIQDQTDSSLLLHRESSPTTSKQLWLETTKQQRARESRGS